MTFFQGISPIAKIAIAIAISIAIWKKIADRDRSFAIADRDRSFAIADLLGDLFSY